MGVRTQNLDMMAANRAKRDKAVCAVERLNAVIAGDMWWSPTIRAAIVAGF